MKSDQTAIRRAGPADAEAISNMVAAAYRHYIDRIGKPPGPMLDDYADVIKRHIVFVAETDRIVGVLVLIRTADSMLLDNIAVDPEQQGKGLGKRLLQLAEAEARKRDLDRLELYTHETMTENIELYRSLGYVETERKQVRGYRRVYLQKNLSG